MKIKETEISVEKSHLDGMEVYRIFDSNTESPIALLSFFKGKKGTLFVDLRTEFWVEKYPRTPNRALKAFKRWWLITNGAANSAHKEVRRQLGQLRRQENFKIAKTKNLRSFSNYAEADE